MSNDTQNFKFLLKIRPSAEFDLGKPAIYVHNKQIGCFISGPTAYPATKAFISAPGITIYL